MLAWSTYLGKREMMQTHPRSAADGPKVHKAVLSLPVFMAVFVTESVPFDIAEFRSHAADAPCA